MLYKYPPEQKEFLIQHVKGRTNQELADLFQAEFGIEMTASKVKSFKANYKLKGEVPRNRPTKTTLERKAFVEAHAEGRTNAEMTELFNAHFGLQYTVKQMKQFKNRHHISSGLTGHFEKGHVPANKGMKGITTGGVETQFKKGHTPHNYMPVGSERVNTDGYVDVKIADPNVWKAKHVLLWEAANGPVPKGCKLLFGDGNRLNVSLENILLISQKQLSVLNRKKLIQNHVDLTRTALIVADIYSKLAERKKERKKQKRRVTS